MNDLNPSPEFEEKVRQAMDVPDASPAFVNKLRHELVRGPVKVKSRFTFRPAWVLAFVLALAVIVTSVPAVGAALGRLLGYVPEVGLVQNTGNLRMLAEPVSVTRDDVTITITSVFVFEDRVELIYEVAGIQETYSNQPDMCGSFHPDNGFWSDADADLRLPDGTIVRRDYAGEYQFENRYAMKPIYAVQIPAGINELTMVLKCIPFTRLGDVPENWEIPFKLIPVPAGTVMGAPVIDVVQPTATQPAKEPVATAVIEIPSLPAPVVTMKLEKLVPMDSATVFYFSMDVENRDPSLISIMPVRAYVIDSQGQKIQLIGNFASQPFEHRLGSLFQYTSASKPADGPLTVLVENAVAYYAPLYVEPKQATPEEMSFTFDAGAKPQHGQTWELNDEIMIAGYPVRITSVRAVNWDDVKTPSFIDGSQGYEYGYQFEVESDPSVKLDVEMDLMQDNCGFAIKTDYMPVSSSLLYSQLCRDAYPRGQVKVTIWELAVLLEDTWQSTWTP